jgi:hypothetical protein
VILLRLVAACLRARRPQPGTTTTTGAASTTTVAPTNTQEPSTTRPRRTTPPPTSLAWSDPPGPAQWSMAAAEVGLMVVGALLVLRNQER